MTTGAREVSDNVDALESRINERLKGDEPIIPWKMRHAATVMSWRNTG